MKNITIIIILLSIFSFKGISQNNKQVVKPAAKPVPLMKNLRDSASYAMGIFLVNVFRQQGINNMNSAMVAKAITDLQGNKPSALSDDQANNAIMGFINHTSFLKSKPRIDAGQKYLSENRKRAGVISRPSGLQYEVIIAGNGPIPISSDTVICHYKGTYIDGVQFDGTNEGSPATFAVTQVIQGWIEALQIMPVGSKWKIYIPHNLAYGASDYNSIPGGSALIFELELLGIKGK